MLEKDEVKKAGLKVAEYETNELVRAIKAVSPELFKEAGFDYSAFKERLGLEVSKTKGYELSFAGKALAASLADSPSKCELKYEKDAKSKNILIKGDNLDALKLLKKAYEGKVKMIYIDPPYNTKSENFIYKDDFRKSEAELIQSYGLDEESVNYLSSFYSTRTHSGWLSFIYPRLKLARTLLKEDGVIFISIDDNEQANLKLICDEIFGEENCVGQFIWKMFHTVKNDAKNVSQNHEFVLCYTRNMDIKRDILQNESADKSGSYPYDDNDGKGKYKLDPIYAKSGGGGYIYKFKGGREWEAPSGTFPRYSIETLRQKELNNEIIWKKGSKNPYSKRYLAKTSQGVKISSILKSEKVGYTKDGTAYLDKLMQDKIFNNPKPINLIKTFIQIATNKNDIILDFFAGSGTTGDAVMRLNAEDGGNRQFILVQLDEKIDSKKPGYAFCKAHSLKPVISSITQERLKRAAKLIKEENPLLAMDLDFKVFSLVDAPKIDKENLNLYFNKTPKDRLANLLLNSTRPITSELLELESEAIYQLGNSIYIINPFSYDKEKLRGKEIFVDAYARLKLHELLDLGDVSVVY